MRDSSPSAVKDLTEFLVEGEKPPASEWRLRMIRSEQCLSYAAWNERTREALLVDPKREDIDAYRAIHRELAGYLWLGVIDSHTHADHISAAAQMAEEFRTPLIMHVAAPSPRVHIRVAKSTLIPARAAPLRILATPGHTPDSITPIWGPFLFGGDTILFGDTGRDDLPGGSPACHYESVQTLKEVASAETIVLPGHDHRGGRASSWATQLRVNASLTQSREDFVREASAFEAPAPKLLKDSLRENFR